jgi:transcriptional regulator with XRE-family HTH domain
MISVGRAIRLIRETRRLKAKDLAEAAELSLPFLSLIETERREPSLTALRKLAKALGVPPEAFMILVQPGDLTATSSRSQSIASLVSGLLDAEEALRRKLDAGEKEDSAEPPDRG